MYTPNFIQHVVPYIKLEHVKESESASMKGKQNKPLF